MGRRKHLKEMTPPEWEFYLMDKGIGTHKDVCLDMGIGECVDENGEPVDPHRWYWRGCSPGMN